MRNYIPCYDSIGISKHRYIELQHFCRQYEEWQSALSAYQRAGKLDAEECRIAAAKVNIILSCAEGVSGGSWKEALIINLCYGIPYEKINKSTMPTSQRSEFFKARKDFFALLNKARI